MTHDNNVVKSANPKLRAERDCLLATDRADAAVAEAASLLEAARAAEAILQTQAVKLSRMEAAAEQDAVTVAHMVEQLEYADWRLMKMSAGGGGKEQDVGGEGVASVDVRKEGEALMSRVRAMAAAADATLAAAGLQLSPPPGLRHHHVIQSTTNTSDAKHADAAAFAEKL